ncbi:MAG: sigma-70 family RNA polymerase sigma factor [Breznakibacter sp.]
MTAIEFNTQLEQVRKHLTRFAYQLTADSENANDLIQDTLFKALANRDKFREDVNFRAWTFTIMRNIFINDYRKGQKYRRVDTAPDHYSMMHRSANFDTPEGRVTMAQVRDTIELLEEEYKTPLLMHMEGFKYTEIAQKLKLKMGTVKSRIFLSRKKLAVLLKDKSLRHVPSLS